MSAQPEFQSLPTGAPKPITINCPEDVDWILDVDSLESAGGDSFRQLHGIDLPPLDCPHFPFGLTSDSASLWNQTVRQLSMASAEANIIITATENKGIPGPIFFARVAGFREEGCLRLAAVFQRIDPSSMACNHDSTWQNWLYLLHEIKNSVSLLKAAENLVGESVDIELENDSREMRQFAINGLENHLRNGVLIATQGKLNLPHCPESVDLKRFFEDLHAAYHPLFTQKNISLEVHFNCDALRVASLDRILLEQLLTNILLNKLRILSGGWVKIDVNEATGKFRGSNFALCISITDNGPPFPEAILQEKSHEVNVRGLMDVNARSHMGLHICRRIIHTLKGDINFYNDSQKQRINLIIPLN